ncbi:MAG: hypothetical protein Q7R71_01465 [bacterium]|nr:hypothetical protein [bacterium]
MIDFLKRNKVALGGGVALLLLIYVYFTYFSGGPSASLTASDSGVPLSTDILVTLQSIHSIKLDNAIFTDPVFVSLTDFGVTISPQNVGRRNPFAPLGAQ